MRGQKLGVQASAATDGTPEAAIVGIVVTDAFEVFFDCTTVSRKVPNLRANPKVAMVIGGMAPGDERTVQLDGVADEPEGEELARLKELYFASFPDGRGREGWSDIAYVRVRPTWVRYSNYNKIPPEIVEFGEEELGSTPPASGA
ncbi:MAG TPA: pyridoxamine 5'-phosphate oxidase family protein [Candidatus Dormibacteraeota bacterium]|nr:pyridoxamine 5'-phosphate oxidase family protein [Candidatus Dormibacteraeota bacterium]HEX2680272.1 pyridoxamine 5'-phosphate oxidase family protein [Candidatus Dormibacteraeota bacterium]